MQPGWLHHNACRTRRRRARRQACPRDPRPHASTGWGVPSHRSRSTAPTPDPASSCAQPAARLPAAGPSLHAGLRRLTEAGEERLGNARGPTSATIDSDVLGRAGDEELVIRRPHCPVVENAASRSDLAEAAPDADLLVVTSRPTKPALDPGHDEIDTDSLQGAVRGADAPRQLGSSLLEPHQVGGVVNDSGSVGLRVSHPQGHVVPSGPRARVGIHGADGTGASPIGQAGAWPPKPVRPERRVYSRLSTRS